LAGFENALCYNSFMVPPGLENQLNKSVIVIADLDDPPDDLAYWLTQSPAKRLAALEQMRQIVYGYDPLTTRLQRVLAVVERT
jgi:hypothetical protein